MTAPARRLTALPAVATRAAGYIRVSTLKQSDGYSPELQEEAIRSYAAEHGLDVAQMESDFESGHKLTRHGYQRLLASVRSGTIGAVIVHQLDRLGRDGGELDRPLPRDGESGSQAHLRPRGDRGAWYHALRTERHGRAI